MTRKQLSILIGSIMIALFIYGAIYLIIIMVNTHQKKNAALLSEINLADQVVPIPEEEAPPPVQPPKEKDVWDFLKQVAPLKSQMTAMSKSGDKNKLGKSALAQMPNALKLSDKNNLDKPVLDQPMDLVGRKAFKAPVAPVGLDVNTFARRANLQARGGSLADLPTIAKPTHKTKPDFDTCRVVETCRDFLIHGHEEVKGFGLYSYLVIPQVPDNSLSYKRCLTAIDLLLMIADSEKAMEKHGENLTPKELNVTYLPIKKKISPPGQTISAEMVLACYDISRCRGILLRLPQSLKLLDDNGHPGPFIISATHPLTRETKAEGYLLFQDLSCVPPDLVSLWICEFKKQAREPRFWDTSSLRHLMLEMRTNISIVAQGFNIVKDSMNQVIKIVRATSDNKSIEN